MSFEIATKIVDELATSSAYQSTRYANIGENGDCWINRQAIDIVRYIKARRPDISVACFTDAQFFTKEKVEIVMREKLLDFVGVNVDGASPANFRAVKRLSSKYVDEFLPTFVYYRDKYRATTRLEVLSLTMRHYVDAVRTHLGHDPIQINDLALLDLEDDFEQIKAKVTPLLRDGDSFHRSTPMFWAERDAVDTSILNYDRYSCPLIHRVLHEAFIAPDGTWYGCCFDANNELVLGNVYETSLYEVEHGEVRREFIEKLVSKRFGEIAGPCKTVNCCQFGIREPVKQREYA